MKIIEDVIKTRSPVTILLLVAGVVMSGWFFYRTKEIWGYFLISVMIAYLLSGPVNSLSSRGLSRTISVSIIFIIVIGSLTLFLVLIIPYLNGKINSFAHEFPEYVTQAQTHIDKLSGWLETSELPDNVKNVPDRFMAGLQEYSISILQRGINSIIGIFSQLYAFLIIPLATFYLLKDVNRFHQTFITLFPENKRKSIDALLGDIGRSFGNFIRSRLKLCIVVGIGMTIGLAVLKVPYPVILGLIAGICEFVPYIGPVVGAIPACIVGLITGKILQVLVMVLIVQALENLVFIPKIMGSEMGLHPLIVIMALLAGGQFAGIGGMVLSVPLVAAVKITGEYILQQAGRNVESGSEVDVDAEGEGHDPPAGRRSTEP